MFKFSVQYKDLLQTYVRHCTGSQVQEEQDVVTAIG